MDTNDQLRFSPPEVSDSHLEQVAKLNGCDPDEVTDRMIWDYESDLKEMRAER